MCLAQKRLRLRLLDSDCIVCTCPLGLRSPQAGEAYGTRILKEQWILNPGSYQIGIHWIGNPDLRPDLCPDWIDYRPRLASLRLVVE